MSVRKLAIRLSRAANRDVVNILLYTRRTWGEQQRASYRAVIYQALELLSRHPQAGRARDDLFPGCRAIQVEQHVLFYHQPEANEIEVLRILHRRQDASSEVTEPHS